MLDHIVGVSFGADESPEVTDRDPMGLECVLEKRAGVRATMVGAMPSCSVKTRKGGVESIPELVCGAEFVGASGSACGKQMVDPLPDNLCGNDSQSCSTNSVRPSFAIAERMKPSKQWMWPVM